MHINYTFISYCLIKFELAILENRILNYSDLNYAGIPRVRKSLRHFAELQQHKSL